VRRSPLAVALVLVALGVIGFVIALAELREGTPNEGESDVPKTFEFGLIGDIPYGAEQQRKTEVLFGKMDAEELAFVVHVGDIKSGDSPCTDGILLREKERFENTANPLVYVPGDNEWTDCYRTGYDPIERLQKLREIFSQGDESLGEKTLPLPARAPIILRTCAGDTAA
jgi:hypothetical protein